MGRHKRCQRCIYRADDNGPHSCDYNWFTGQTRSARVKSPDELEPENCPLYKHGPRIKIRNEFLFGKGDDR
jgi:hypothetical protein